MLETDHQLLSVFTCDLSTASNASEWNRQEDSWYGFNVLLPFTLTQTLCWWQCSISFPLPPPPWTLVPASTSLGATQRYTSLTKQPTKQHKHGQIKRLLAHCTHSLMKGCSSNSWAEALFIASASKHLVEKGKERFTISVAMTSIVMKISTVYHFWYDDVSKNDNFYWACFSKSRQCPKNGPSYNMNLKDLQIPIDHKMVTPFLRFSAYNNNNNKNIKNKHF